MAFTLIWSPKARRDLWDLLDYIAESNRQAAADFGSSVLHAVQRAGEFPESGRVVPEFGDPTLREITRRPCRIVYRVKKNDKEVEIVRIWHAARGCPEI